ncbi:MAG: lysylphosphatidylglycerol synthase domain-containing protein [Woeseiaceae bacterium]
MFEDIRSNPAAKRSPLKVTLQAITIALFILAIVYFLRKYSADISNLKMLSLLDIVVIGAWSFVSYTAYAYAVYIVFLDLGLKNLGPIAWLRIYFVSRLVNFFITQGGNLYRLLVLKKNYNFSYTNTVGVTGFLIWINAAIALLASAYALDSLQLDSRIAGLSLLGWCGFLLAGLMIVPLTAILLAGWSRTASIARHKLAAPFVQVADFFTSTIKNTGLFAIVTILSIIHFCFFLGVNYFAFRAIGQQIDLGVVCVFTTAFVFTRYINVVPGNIGVSELVGGLMSEQMGVGFSNGLIVSGIVRMVEVLVILLTGLIYGKILAVSFFRRD